MKTENQVLSRHWDEITEKERLDLLKTLFRNLPELNQHAMR